MPLTHRLIPLVLMAFAACNSETDRGPSVTQLHLSDTALISIPDAAPDGRYTMAAIVGATQARNGAVAVWTQSELYLFDSTGAYVGMPGRKGNGPGEFRTIGGVGECSDGTLTVWDQFSRHLVSISTTDGTVSSSDPGVQELFMIFAGCYGGGPIVVHRPFDFSSQELKQETLQVIRLSAAGTGRETLFTGNGILHAGPVMQLFPAFRVVAARAGLLVVGDNASGVLYRWQGKTHDSVSISLPHKAVSKAAGDSMKQLWYDVAKVGGEVNPEVRQSIDLGWSKLPMADSIPLFSALLMDDSALVWMSDYAGHPGVGRLHIRRWTELARDGIPVAALELPAGFDLMQITHGRALGIQEKEDGSLAVEVRAINIGG